MTNENELILEEFYANSFMLIEKSRPVVIDFTSRKKNQNFIEFVGDQATGKSSRLMGILYAMGARFGVEKKFLANETDKSIDEGLKFKWNGKSYHVIVSTSRVEVKVQSEKSDKWTKIDEEPMTFLKEVFGPVSMSPFEVRTMKGKKQIEYFQTVFGSGEDASKKMQKLESQYDDKFSERRDINRDAKLLTGALEVEPLYQNREASEKKFAKPISADKEKKKYDELSEKKNSYQKYENTVTIAEGDLRDKLNKIADLEKQLGQAKAEKEKLQESVERGNKWLKDNIGVLKEFEVANKEWLNLSTTLSDYNKWKDLLKKEAQLTEKQEQSITLTGDLDVLNQKILKLTKECIPAVDGLEIKVAVGLDKTNQEEGVFYNGKSISILSESEYVQLWCLIYDAAGVNVIVLENLTSMGSDTVATLNALAKGGAQIFASRVDRKQKDVKVIFSSKIE